MTVTTASGTREQDATTGAWRPQELRIAVAAGLLDRERRRRHDAHARTASSSASEVTRVTPPGHLGGLAPRPVKPDGAQPGVPRADRVVVEPVADEEGVARFGAEQPARVAEHPRVGLAEAQRVQADHDVEEIRRDRRLASLRR